MICPYCEVEITMSAVDAEDGYCPECGTIIAASTIFQEDVVEDDVELDDIEDDFEDDFEEDFKDDFDDDDDL